MLKCVYISYIVVLSLSRKSFEKHRRAADLLRLQIVIGQVRVLLPVEPSLVHGFGVDIVRTAHGFVDL